MWIAGYVREHVMTNFYFMIYDIIMLPDAFVFLYMFACLNY